MPQDWTIHGVPLALQTDGRWLEDIPPANRHEASHARRPLLALIVLLLLGDQLFWHQTPGLSLAIFAVAVFAVCSPRHVSAKAFAVLVLSVLPVVEYVQALSLAILAFGLPTAIALNVGAKPLPALLTLVRRLPVALPRDLIIGLGQLPRAPTRSLVRNWAFPLGGTVVLLSLLAQANPVLADWIAALTNLPLDPVNMALRALFWAGMAVLLWPLLTPVPANPLNLPHFARRSLGLNANSVANALILFNAMLALQTAMDGLYLYSGSTPPGMTLATYAHRGAYPLLATALLAGAFALAARPWVAERPMLKPLLLLWLAQNVLLTLSALYRLDLYVQSYGLTYLRVHAAIWMVLVAVGLALTLTQIAAQKTNRWLLIRCAALSVGTLYLCAFINFAAVIARVNVAEDKIDTDYLCDLGPTAVAEIPAALQSYYRCFTPPQIDGWRDWGYRNWRVLHNLEKTPPVEKPLEDTRRG